MKRPCAHVMLPYVRLQDQYTSDIDHIGGFRVVVGASAPPDVVAGGDGLWGRRRRGRL
jgi:hypothetical protein